MSLCPSPTDRDSLSE